MRQPIVPQLEGPSFILWEHAQRERYELHRGFVFAFAGGTIIHDRLAFNMRVALEGLFSTPCRTTGSDVKVRISQDTYYYPDVTVTCEPISGDETIIEQPRIVVEVLSASTSGYDLVEKRSAYRSSPSIVAYVIMHSDSRRVEVDCRSSNGNWETETFDDREAIVDGHRLQLDVLYAGT